jgi:dTDP-4-amino-4,6-dideoxygalactose transaminase
MTTQQRPETKSRTPTPPFIPFALPDIGEDEIQEVVDSLRNNWLTTGPKTRRFEHDFSAFLGSDVQSIAVNSATAGLHLALEALGLKEGDEVITTPFTFTATAEVVRYFGANVRFVDIDAETMNISVSELESAIGPRTRAILPVHFGGLACDMSGILTVAKRRGLHVVEDAAHAFPATYAGQLIGTLDSDATVFSFYATKTLATGEGGMIVTRNSAIAARCRIMRLHGISRDTFDRYVAETPNWHYEVVAPGFKYNLTDLASAIGIHQLRRASDLRNKREAIARRYDEAFDDLSCDLPPKAPNGDLHAWHLYVIRLTADAPISRDEFIEEMTRAGIGCSVHFIPLQLHPYWRDTYHLQPDSFPIAYKTFKRVVSLPLYTKMSVSDQDRVIQTVRKLLGRR